MNEEQSLISVIMATYYGDGCEELKEAVESILKQSYSNLELILTVDGPVPEERKLFLQELEKSDRRVKLLWNEVNRGPGAARNSAIKVANGDYITIFDADDVAYPDKLEKQLNYLLQESLDLVGSTYTELNRNKRYIIAPKQATYNSLLNGNYIGNLTGVYDTEKVGKVYQQKVFHEDYIMWLEILKKGYIAKNTNTITALYRVSKDSFSSSKIKVLKWQWNIYRTILKCNLLESVYHFIVYAVKAFLKYIK